jgi:hypothetical protein
MPTIFDLQIKDITTVSSFLKDRNDIFLSCLRPLDKHFLINTVFKWEFGGTKVHLLGNWDFWKKKISLKKSGNEFTAILPLKPGFFEFKFIVDGKEKCFPKKIKKSNFEKDQNNIKNIKRLDNEIISSESLLDGETKIYSYYPKTSKSNTNDGYKSPCPVPLQLLASIYSKSISSEKFFLFSKFMPYIDSSKTVFFNHLIFYKNLFTENNKPNQIFFSKIRFKQKIGSFYFFKFKKFGFKNLLHPIKILF